MGIIYLTLSKIFAIGKMIAMKKCGRLSSGPKNSIIINLLRAIGCVCISALICAFSGFDPMTSEGIIYSLLSGVSMALILFLWVLCAQNGSLSAVEIFCMIGGVVLPMLISPLIFENATITISQWIGSLLLFPAAYCFSGKGKGNDKERFKASALLLLCATGIANAGTVLTQKLFTERACGNIADFNLITFISCTIVLALLFPIFKKENGESTQKNSIKSNKKQLSVYILAAVVTLYASQYLGTLATVYLSPAFLFPLSYAIGMPMTQLTDFVIFKDKVTTVKLFGMLLVITAIVLIGISK